MALTQQQKRDRLAKLKSEVPDFHDWLGVLFPRMANVQYVEYTHGQEEKGADFVLEMHVPATGRNIFIGVVVKRGQIKQDTSDVDRQIRECGLKRKIKGGKQEVRLSYIWVVNNETISRGAKDKIHDEYERLSVDFYSAEDVVRWTDELAPYLWENLPSKIGHYLNGVRTQIEAREQESSLLGANIPEPYIELDIVPIDVDTYSNRRKHVEPISLGDEVRQRRVVLIEAGMGAGKSKLLRRLGLAFAAESAFNESKLLPILICFRELKEKYQGSIGQLVEQTLGDLAEEVRAGRAEALVMVDGLDEFIDPDAPSADPLRAMVDEVRALSRVKAVFASRTGFISDLTLRSTPDLRRLEVRPLTSRKISTFVRDMCAEKNLKSRVVQDINRSELFRQLPQNPIAALLLTRLLLQSPTRDELPQTLTELYTQALELMLGRWDMKKGSGLVTQQEYDVCRRVCGLVARRMIENNIPAIGITEVEATVTEYIRDRNLVTNRDRVLQRLFDRSSVLVRHEQSRTVTFRHRSFSEYFCADEWHHAGQFRVDNRALQRHWYDVYFFAIGMRPDCEQALTEVLACQPMSETERWGKWIAPASYMLAGHMTPYRIVQENLYKLMLEAARLYCEIVNGKQETEVAVLSEMQLLFVMQLLARDFYGYTFFRPALDDAALQISDSLEPDDVKAFALFFIGAIGIELDYPDAMTFLLDRYKVNELPFSLSLAIRAEAGNLDPKKLPPRLKAYDRAIAKILKSSPNTKNAVDRLTRTSISSRIATLRGRKKTKTQKV